MTETRVEVVVTVLEERPRDLLIQTARPSEGEDAGERLDKLRVE